MSQANEYWSRLVRATPALADETTKMTLTVASLRKQIAKAHHDGFKCGMETAKSLQNLGADVSPLETVLNILRKKTT